MQVVLVRAITRASSFSPVTVNCS